MVKHTSSTQSHNQTHMKGSISWVNLEKEQQAKLKRKASGAVHFRTFHCQKHGTQMFVMP